MIHRLMRYTRKKLRQANIREFRKTFLQLTRVPTKLTDDEIEVYIYGNVLDVNPPKAGKVKKEGDQ